MNEVILLERPALGRTWKRRSAMNSRNLGRICGGAALDLVCFLLCVTLLARAFEQVSELWEGRYRFWVFDFAESGAPFHFQAFELAAWVAVVFLVVLRFVTYLDCRIRREGWDVELKLRGRAAELKAAESW
jgi:hypothetical protein